MSSQIQPSLISRSSKEAFNGIFHHVSEDHLHRLCDEFSFRWNFRKVTDGERTIEAVRGIIGKRLSYKPSIHESLLN